MKKIENLNIRQLNKLFLRSTRRHRVCLKKAQNLFPGTHTFAALYAVAESLKLQARMAFAEADRRINRRELRVLPPESLLA